MRINILVTNRQASQTIPLTEYLTNEQFYLMKTVTLIMRS